MQAKTLRINYMFKFLLLVLGLGFFAQNGMAQLDSVSVTVQFTTEVNPYDTLSTTDALNISIEVSDTSDVGMVLCDVMQLDDGYPIVKTMSSHTDLQTGGQLTATAVKLIYYEVDPSKSYEIKILLRDAEGANLPSITTNYNPL